MLRLLVSCLVLPLLCGCSFLGQPQRPNDPPAAPAPEETAPSPAQAPDPPGAGRQFVTWDMEELMPRCPRCGEEVQLRNTICPKCYARFRWHDVPVEDTPQGAFEKLKLAEIYNDLDTYRECMCRADLKQVEKTLGHERVSGREGLLAPQVVEEKVDGDQATLTIVERGQRVKLQLLREAGAWKFCLAPLREQVRIDEARILVRQLAEAIERFAHDHGEPPSRESWVTALAGRDLEGKPYFQFNWHLYSTDFRDGEDPKAQRKPASHIADPWLQDVHYHPDRSDGKRPFLLYSGGPDGRDDGGAGDDILPE